MNGVIIIVVILLVIGIFWYNENDTSEAFNPDTHPFVTAGPKVVQACQELCQDIFQHLGPDQEHRACIDTCLYDYNTKDVPSGGVNSGQLIFEHKRRLGLI